MTGLALFVLAVYTVSLLYITVYCLLQFNLLYHYKQSNNPTKHPVSFADMVPTEASTQEFMLVGAAPGFALSGSSLAPAAEPLYLKSSSGKHSHEVKHPLLRGVISQY